MVGASINRLRDDFEENNNLKFFEKLTRQYVAYVNVMLREIYVTKIVELYEFSFLKLVFPLRKQKQTERCLFVISI